jgi:hypothetical protein
VLVNLDLYRACLKSKGWARVAGAKASTPAGLYRGQEDEGPITVGDLPRQVPVMGTYSSARGSGSNFGPR